MGYTFDEKVATPLCEIMGRNKSDKGHADIQNVKHNYTTLYYHLFKEWQFKPLRIFELGLGTNNLSMASNMGADGRPGASLYGWAEFFPNATIYGADIDISILFNTERIKTYFCDQTNPHIINYMWRESELAEPFDIMVEDGLHSFSANVCFFENSIHRLGVGGYYIIEDIIENETHLFEDKMNVWRATYPNMSFDLIRIPCRINEHDNIVMVVKRNM
jgi:hypothetical protein